VGPDDGQPARARRRESARLTRATAPSALPQQGRGPAAAG
jgi:hypothetical protein